VREWQGRREREKVTSEVSCRRHGHGFVGHACHAEGGATGMLAGEATKALHMPERNAFSHCHVYMPRELSAFFLRSSFSVFPLSLPPAAPARLKAR